MPAAINRTLRLPQSQFFPGTQEKSGLAIHHTVGGTAASTFNHWLNTPDAVGTAYIIERDGTIFEVFEPDAWAWQFGLPWSTAKKAQFEKRYVGIELAGEGGLIEHDGQLYCFDRVSDRTRKPRGEAFDYGADYRGYRWFDRFEKPQLDSLVALVNDLCTRFAIPRRGVTFGIDYFRRPGVVAQGLKIVEGNYHTFRGE